MFHRPTVFVLGAGASWHYGYPTGQELVSDVIGQASNYLSYCKQRLEIGEDLWSAPDSLRARILARANEVSKIWRNEIDLIEEFSYKLRKADPIVIDYFLGWNERVQDIGRLLIAAALLHRESRIGPDRNINRDRNDTSKDNWIRFLVHQLLLKVRNSKDLFENDVHFITYNYDTSLERHLRSGLAAHQVIEESHIYDFMHEGRVIHMYGALKRVKINPAEWTSLTSNYSEAGGVARMNAATALISKWHAASQDLKVIDPHTKEENQSAKALLSKAEQVYFLGFGFDDENVRRLGFEHQYNLPYSRDVFFTNYLDIRSVNKAAARAFGVPGLGNFENVAFGNNTTYEKSTRDTYRAIELDFGAFAQ